MADIGSESESDGEVQNKPEAPKKAEVESDDLQEEECPSPKAMDAADDDPKPADDEPPADDDAPADNPAAPESGDAAKADDKSPKKDAAKGKGDGDDAPKPADGDAAGGEGDDAPAIPKPAEKKSGGLCGCFAAKKGPPVDCDVVSFRVTLLEVDAGEWKKTREKPFKGALATALETSPLLLDEVVAEVDPAAMAAVEAELEAEWAVEDEESERVAAEKQAEADAKAAEKKEAAEAKKREKEEAAEGKKKEKEEAAEKKKGEAEAKKKEKEEADAKKKEEAEAKKKEKEEVRSALLDPHPILRRWRHERHASSRFPMSPVRACAGHQTQAQTLLSLTRSRAAETELHTRAEE